MRLRDKQFSSLAAVQTDNASIIIYLSAVVFRKFVASATCYRLWGPPSLLYNGYWGSFSGGKARPGLIHPLPPASLQSADNELIPARNASLAAVQGSASGSNAYYYPT
jgi:hypothetical protein